MPTIALLNQSGEKIKDLELSATVFGIEELNQQVIYDVVNCQRAAMRQGTHDVKNRSEVRGGGKKPWRQKGTGRARQGSIRAPQWRGGGIVFGPTPRSYAYSMPRKQRRLAIKSVLSQKVLDQNLVVLDKLTLAAPKTKDFVAILNGLKLEGKVLVISDDKNVQLSAKNLPKVKVVPVNSLNVEDVVNYDKLVMTQDDVKKIEEVLA